MSIFFKKINKNTGEAADISMNRKKFWGRRDKKTLS